MRIRAVRVRELGCFAEPVALEGLSGGLDVLAGPNEFGKSTLLRALQALFTLRHTAQSRAVDRLKPYCGGAPLIEADFEAGGRLWRLRKQFVSERQALLTDLTTNKVVARGEEAHQRALELIGGGSGEHCLGLLWLEQGSVLPSREGRSGENGLDGGKREVLSQIVERELTAATAGGHELRIVRARLIEERNALVTERRRQPRGEYAAAITSRNSAMQELEAARMQAQAAAERLSRLAELRSRCADLNDPEKIAARRERVEKGEAELEAAKASRQQLKLAETKVQACESRLGEVEQNHRLLTQGLEEVSKLEADAVEAQEKKRELAASLDQASKALEEARAQREELRGALDHWQQRLRIREQLDRQREAAARLAEAEERLSEVRGAAQRAEEIRAQLAEIRVTDERVEAAAREARTIEALEARITAQLPKVRVTYQPGAAGKIRIGGKAVDDGTVLTPSRPLTLEIEGIGAITIDPAVSESVEADKANLQTRRSALADLLAAMDVPDLAEARKRLDERHRLERELAQAADRLAMRAPDGLKALSAEVERLRELAGSETVGSDTVVPERSEIEGEIERLSFALRDVEQRIETLVQEQAGLREQLAQLNAAAQARQQRLEHLARVLPPAEERSRRRAELEAEVAAAQQNLNEAVRELTAWREKAPDDAAMRALEAELTEARRQQQSAAEEIARVEKELAVLEAQIERDRQDGLSMKVADLEGRVAALNARVHHFERELAAIDLLLEIISDVEQQSRELYFKPILQRLEPYLNYVFPGAKVGLGPNFSVEAVIRGDVAEQLGSLSDGTQEQIAVLARLAFARLLADAGQPTPLILDDALVYSDDSRIEALFEVLRRAAEVHQVIIFTCRSRTFEQLGGTRLSLRPWRPDAALAA